MKLLKKIFIYLLPCFFICCLLGKSTTVVNERNNCIDYYRLINRAEISLVENNYQNAIKYFKEAFSLEETLFFNDVNNAVLCAIEENDLRSAFEFAEKLSEFSVSVDYFDGEKFKKLKEEKKLFLGFIEKYQMKENKQYNQSLREIVDYIFLTDQQIRENSRNSDGRFDLEKIYKQDSLNVRLLLEKIEAFGFPNDKNIGVLTHKGGTEIPPLKLPLLHFYKGGLIQDSLLLLNAMDNGDMKPEEFIKYYRYISKVEYLSEPVFYHDGNYYLRKGLNDETIRKINFNRAKIGMATVEEEAKKIIYYRKSRKFRICQDAPVFTCSSCPNSVIKKFIKDAKILN